jgi:hypothetical protein
MKYYLDVIRNCIMNGKTAYIDEFNLSYATSHFTLRTS